MELALCDVYKDAKIGKILIQTNEKTGDPEVIEKKIKTEGGRILNINFLFFNNS